MAIKWMSYIWEERTDLHGAELLCAIAIADHADADGVCYPGIKTIAQKLRCTERHAQDLIHRLEAKKVFKIKQGKGRGNLSAFQFLKGEESCTLSEEKKVKNPAPIKKIKGEQSCREKVNNRAVPSYKEESFKEPGENLTETAPAPEQFQTSLRNIKALENEQPQPERNDSLKDCEALEIFEKSFKVRVGNATAEAINAHIQNLPVWKNLILEKIGFADEPVHIRNKIKNWIFTAYNERLEKQITVKKGSEKLPSPEEVFKMREDFAKNNPRRELPTR